MKIIAKNKKAFFEYDIHDKVEAGIVLTGDEVKSIRAGQVSLMGAFAHVHKGELFLVNARIAPYKQACEKPDEEMATRRRKLLLHKKELSRLVGDVSRKGVTIVPLKLYLSPKNLVKVQLGICKHKKAAGKKQVLKERDLKQQSLIHI